MKYSILIADDEADIVAMLASFFLGKGYDVLTAHSGREALEQAQRSPDLILLDASMPDLDGMEACRRMRGHISCPILFLTARVEEADRVNGFAAGGDDYIVKPFSLAELEARVSAHLRREARRSGSARVRFSGDLSIDYGQRTVTIAGQAVALVKKEFDVVALLSQNPGQVFDKERIYERVWGYDGQGSSSVVAEHIRRIRAKLAAFTPQAYIETVWGSGYKWVK